MPISKCVPDGPNPTTERRHFMKNQKSIAKMLGRATSDLNALPPDLQLQAICSFQIRIKELMLENAEQHNRRKQKNTINRFA